MIAPPKLYAVGITAEHQILRASQVERFGNLSDRS
jgi:hypothetical protein